MTGGKADELLPTEPIGSIPRPQSLIEQWRLFDLGRLTASEVALAEASAVAVTLADFEATGSPVITDGEQGKRNFLAYPLSGLRNFTDDGFGIQFADGHVRQLPQLTGGPFRYGKYACDYLRAAKALTSRPVKQAVVSASALSLFYPAGGIAGYSREQYLCDLIGEVEHDIRQCLEAGADSVQMDFGEARLAIKIDPSMKLLDEFIELNNWVLERFSEEDRSRIGVHSCAGCDRGSHHSGEIGYECLLPALFRLKAGRFYLQLASEKDRCGVLASIGAKLGPTQFLFAGVIDPANPRVESAEEVRDRVLEAARFLPLDRLGTTDDCGFASFADDGFVSRETAFDKIKARVEGTALARELLSR